MDPGVYTVPLIVNWVTAKVPASGSESLAKTLPVSLVASSTVFVSATKTGGSLTGVTAKFNSAVSVAPSASAAVYVIVGTEPL